MASNTEPRAAGERGSLDREFAPFAEPVGSFVRSLVTLAEFRGDLSNYAAEPNLRIVRTAFGKWSVEVLVDLSEHPHRGFGELRADLRGVSARVLSKKLKMLEGAGLVDRTVVPRRPPRPEYALTDRASLLFRVAGGVLAYVRTTALSARKSRETAPEAGPSPPPPAAGANEEEA